VTFRFLYFNLPNVVQGEAENPDGFKCCLTGNLSGFSAAPCNMCLNTDVHKKFKYVKDQTTQRAELIFMSFIYH